MAVREVSAKEVLQDIRSGMDDAAMRKKYRLSSKGLQSLYKKLIAAGLLGNDLKPISRKLNLLAILADIRSGMSQSDLLRKYNLSESMLRQLGKKLLAAKGRRLASDAETIIMDPVEFPTSSEFVKHEVDFDLPAYDADRPDIIGLVRDVSEESVSFAGIEVDVGETKTLVILSDELGQFSSFEFEGCCLWAFADPSDGTRHAGFAINKISESDAQELQKLIRLITTGG